MLLISLSLSHSLFVTKLFSSNMVKVSFKLEMFEKHCHIWRKRKFIKMVGCQDFWRIWVDFSSSFLSFEDHCHVFS